MEDLYKTLGVAKDATPDQIKSAYRKLARRLHPDLNPGNKQTEEKFKKVSAAYDILGDAAKRARYDAGEIDASGTERPRHAYRDFADAAGNGKFGSGFRFGENVDDIFAELLRRRERGRSAGSGFFTDDDLSSRGGDAQYSLKIDFAEAILGATKRITLPTGKHLDVKVPPGTKDGAVLRLRGQGQPGRMGGAAGDALIEMKVAAHPLFTREGNDILVTLPISLPEAVLGGKVTVPTVDGKVAMTIPPNTSSGAVLRLKGKGVPNGKSRGDQMVTLRIALPEAPDPELEAFMKAWVAKHPYDARSRTEPSWS